MPIMEILIGPECENSIDVIGGSGEGCRKYTQDLEIALGTIVNSQRKPEFYCAGNETCIDTGT